MEIISTIVFALLVISVLIECSSQSERNPHSERYTPPSSPLADRQPEPNRSPPAEPILRERDRSPPGRPPPLEVLGYSLEELGYLRLVPRKNQSIRFEFRKYIFSSRAQIRFRTKNKFFRPVPNQEYIVLSAPDGDIYGILEHSGFLRGLYRTHLNRSRAKINMITGAIDDMTLSETRLCPVGENHPIFPQTFGKEVADHDSLLTRSSLTDSAETQHPPDPTAHKASSSRARSLSPPGRAPSLEVLGYSLSQLGCIRLIPRVNRERQFEFRRYFFPIDVPIRMLDERGKRLPILNREYIVLSTSTGDVFAILEYTGFLRAFYRSDRSHLRVKVNMISGAIQNMTSNEMSECLVGKKNPIFPYNFRRVLKHRDSLQTVYH